MKQVILPNLYRMVNGFYIDLHSETRDWYGLVQPSDQSVHLLPEYYQEAVERAGCCST